MAPGRALPVLGSSSTMRIPVQYEPNDIHSLPSARRLDAFDPAVLERADSTTEDNAAGGSVHALVWGRDTKPETVAAFLRKVDADLLITGHIPCEQGFAVPNDQQLILDSR